MLYSIQKQVQNMVKNGKINKNRNNHNKKLKNSLKK